MQGTNNKLNLLILAQIIFSMIGRNFLMNAAKEVGFDMVGVVAVEPLHRERKFFEQWLLAGRNSTLAYLERNVEKRFDSSLLVDSARSVVICAVSYLSPYSRGYDKGCRTKIASYALTRDYHLTIKEMLADLAARLRIVAPDMRFRVFSDSAPVAEKSLAVRAGLGWIGRNSLLVTPRRGSMLLLGEIISDCEFDEYDVALSGVGCGSCRACIDACPNGAILDDCSIDTSRCISCRTIERDEGGVGINLDGWIFGCDACQVVCPFNRHAPEFSNPRFAPKFHPDEFDEERWHNLSIEEFDALAGDTPMMRAGLERIKSNIGR